MSLFQPGIPEQRPAVAESLPESISVADYLAELTQTIKQSSRKTWMWGEISEYAERGGHHYFSLVSPRSDRPGQAKVRAALFRGSASPIIATFKSVTGSLPRVGMRILILATGQFDATFGYTLIVSQIDATYTVGDAEARLRAIRESLQKSGDYKRLKALSLPRDFVRVAVIAPESAAGLGDFRAQADRLDHAGVCGFHYFPANFQGKEVEFSFLQAIRRVAASGPYDLVVVIRGGGAQADLAEVNIESVARALARLPFPVAVGIGHERDSTLLDEIASKRFDTPSKVIAHIESTVVNNAIKASREVQNMVQLARAAAEAALNRVDAEIQRQRASVKKSCERALSESSRTVALIHRDAKATANRVGERAVDLRERSRLAARQLAESQKRLTSMRIQSIRAYRPDQIMGMGYSVVRTSGGEILRDAEAAIASKSIRILFHSGEITAIPQHNKKESP